MGIFRGLFSTGDEDEGENHISEVLNQVAFRRILVLGQVLQTRVVTSYSWDSLPRNLNVADYDSVILDFVSFIEDRKLAGGINLELLPTREQFGRLIFSEESEVIAIGVPNTEIGFEDPEDDDSAGIVRRLPFYAGTFVTWWLPAFPRIISESGEEIRDIDQEFEYYFRHVQQWSYHVTNEMLDNLPRYSGGSEYLRVIDPRTARLSGSVSSIANTRFQQPIAFELKFWALAEKRIVRMDEEPFELLKESGRIIWLPPPTTITRSDAVRLILQERYGIGTVQEPPAWVQMYPLPNEIPLQEEILRLDQGIQRLEEELAAIQLGLDEEQWFRGLLYEQGENVLEPIVRDSLRILGAQVEDPHRRGREDGRLIDPSGRSGMLEIKGRGGTLRLSDVRELHDWVSDAVANEGWDGKGLLIANLFNNEPPSERRDIFPRNAVQTAERFDQCLMTTTQLFRALRSNQRGALDVQEFWDAIFGTVGICTLPELED